MVERVSSLDDGYATGDLSVFPEAIDDKESLYEVKNNAETRLRTGLSYTGKIILVEDASSFPNKGLIRVGVEGSGNYELIYYDSKTKNTFKNLIRGFAGSRQGQWPFGSKLTNAVTAEPHNAVKDAIINIEKKVGVKENPENETLSQKLNYLEARFLAPRAIFRAYPKKGPPPLTVTFQNFSEGDIIRYLWDFGDGSQSVEKNPKHEYLSEGIYTVKLNVITSSGAQGFSNKLNYIKVSEDERTPFFYIVPTNDPKTFRFVDQTDGDIKQRFWVFGDGTNQVSTEPNKHEILHTYEKGGIYEPSLLIVFSNESLKRVFLPTKDKLVVPL
jgi:PKD repeat protein